MTSATLTHAERNTGNNKTQPNIQGIHMKNHKGDVGDVLKQATVQTVHVPVCQRRRLV